MHMNKIKAQSAMEYLMTYGWAILIIAVVLGALFSLGVFNSSSLIGTSCVALSGYYCANPVLSTTGTLTLTVGQATGTTYTSATVYIVPSGQTFNSVDPANYVIPGGLSTGQTVPVTITMPTSSAYTGFPSSYSTVGTTFTGYVWLAYTTPSSGPSVLESQIATLSVKSS
ncbi:MAG: hypothetical protein QXR58_02950 [Candidatus Micrarchaeaceae archaeon]